MCRCRVFNRTCQSYHRAARRILYVGRDLALLASLQTRLSDCCVVRSPNGGVAYIFLRGEIDYALLLIDEELPDTTGQAVAGFAREIKRYAETPIIILTRGELLNAGAGVFCERPDEVELIAKVIMRLLPPSKSTESVETYPIVNHVNQG